MFILIIYMSNYQILLMQHVFTMYLLMLHVFLHVCNVAEENRCLSSPVSRDKPGPGLTTELYMYVHVSCDATGSHTCCILTEMILYPFSVYTVYSTQYCDCINKLCYIR